MWNRKFFFPHISQENYWTESTEENEERRTVPCVLAWRLVWRHIACEWLPWPHVHWRNTCCLHNQKPRLASHSNTLHHWTEYFELEEAWQKKEEEEEEEEEGKRRGGRRGGRSRERGRWRRKCLKMRKGKLKKKKNVRRRSGRLKSVGWLAKNIHVNMKRAWFAHLSWSSCTGWWRHTLWWWWRLAGWLAGVSTCYSMKSSLFSSTKEVQSI